MQYTARGIRAMSYAVCGMLRMVGGGAGISFRHSSVLVCPVFGTRYSVLDTRYSVHRSSVFRTRYAVCGIHCSVLGVWYAVRGRVNLGARAVKCAGRD
eukprot:7859060-Karenia_brevis.AAC.1